MAESEAHKPSGAASGGELLKLLVSLVIWFGVMAAIMFVPAGSWSWPRGWIFMGAYAGLTAICCVWLWIANPEIFAARRKIQKGTKAWDVLLTNGIVLGYLSVFVISALDDGRFHWAPQPDWVVWLGLALFIPGFLGFAWAQSVNRNFEATVRIQTDRGHQVISSGPYAVVRHPGYAFAIPMAIGTPLTMGSLYGLIPIGIMILFVLIRTLGEDATLKAELPGYAEYAQRVRWRWLPGIF